MVEGTPEEPTPTVSFKMADLSILETVKKLLNQEKDYTFFDLDMVVHINSAFGTLHQLGVGPDIPFEIEGYEEKWSNFSVNVSLSDVRSYIVDYVRLRFDPPPNAFAVSAIQDRIKESAWRLNVAAEGSR